VYMEVHWLVDVAAGLLLGAVSVKLVDRLLAALDRREPSLVGAQIGPQLEPANDIAQVGRPETTQ